MKRIFFIILIFSFAFPIHAQTLDVVSVQLNITKPKYEGIVTFYNAYKEGATQRKRHVTLRINYASADYKIDYAFSDNLKEMYKVDELLRPVANNEAIYEITSISIQGFSSPEESNNYDFKLSQRRIDFFTNYIETKYGLKSLPKIKFVSMGEDWDGLRSIVERSDMEYKQEVLSIIANIDILKGRKEKLMELADGQVYRYMLENFFPSLRRIEMDVVYVIRPESVQQPDNFYPKYISRNNLYDVAAKYFPNDITALVNAASVALVEGDLEKAWYHLSKIQEEPEAYNNLGVYYWLQGNIGQAENYFLRAITAKVDEIKARKNLDQLYASQENN